MLFWLFLQKDRREPYDPRRRVLLTGKEYAYEKFYRSPAHDYPMVFESVLSALVKGRGPILCRVHTDTPNYLFEGGVSVDALKIVASANVFSWIHRTTLDCAHETLKLLPKAQNVGEEHYLAILKKGLDYKESWLTDQARVKRGKNDDPLKWTLENRHKIDAFLADYSNGRKNVADYWLYYLAGKAVSYSLSGAAFDDPANLNRFLPDILCQAYAYSTRSNNLGDTSNASTKEGELNLRFEAEVLEQLKQRSRYDEAA